MLMAAFLTGNVGCTVTVRIAVGTDYMPLTAFLTGTVGCTVSS